MLGDSKDETLKLVRDRLEFVDIIFGLHKQFIDHSMVQMIGEHGWTHPWRYFDALMNYLLLTCFDRLGQSTDWVSFSEWLSSGRKHEERAQAEKTITPGASPVEIAKHFASAYQIAYGVKSSFNNFILTVLTEDERHELLKSIQIVRAEIHNNVHEARPALGYIEGEKKKCDALFQLRNVFTHRAVNIGSPGGGVYKDIYEPTIINGLPMKGYIEVLRQEKGSEWIIYQVRDWPFVLIRCIKAALLRQATSEIF